MFSTFFLLSLCLIIFSSSFGKGDVIVSDNFGSSLSLPLTSGTTISGWEDLNPQVSTTHYIISIFINDDTEPGQTVPSQEAFYIENNFGFALLQNMTYQNTNEVLSPQLTTLGNVTNPNIAIGMYTFTFYIPEMQFIQLNITYLSFMNPIELDHIYIYVVNNFVAESSVVGDPVFVTFQNQKFQCHGISGNVYNLISEKTTQINSQFEYLPTGRCPKIDISGDENNLNIIPFRHTSVCFQHPGSYIHSLSFLQYDAVNHNNTDMDWNYESLTKPREQLYSFFIESGSYDYGFQQVNVNTHLPTYMTNTYSLKHNHKQKEEIKSVPIKVGETFIVTETFFLNYIDNFHILVRTKNYEFLIQNSDSFMNIQVKVLIPLNRVQAHGLLGQTSQRKIYQSPLKYVEGVIEDYEIDDQNIFGYHFLFNKFEFPYYLLSL